ncbi:MAG: hypothetical protein R3237_00185 [Nitrosopumilaceae archaeon]|nr:hypothetical protein [Nitrosopumilaceae archaeon]
MKSEFLNRLIEVVDLPVIFFDIDMLYSGYIKSGLIKKNNKVTIIRGGKKDFNQNLEKIIKRISQTQVLVIIDTLNGVYNLFDDLESARNVNAAIMLLSSISRQTKSMIIVSGIVAKNEDGDIVLSPSGRHLIRSKTTGTFFVSILDSQIILKSLDDSVTDQFFAIEK